MSDLRGQLIKLGSENPDLQKHLYPVIESVRRSKNARSLGERDIERVLEDRRIRFRGHAGGEIEGEVSGEEFEIFERGSDWVYRYPDGVEVEVHSPSDLEKQLEYTEDRRRAASNMKDELIRLGNENPDLREDLRPILDIIHSQLEVGKTAEMSGQTLIQELEDRGFRGPTSDGNGWTMEKNDPGGIMVGFYPDHSGSDYAVHPPGLAHTMERFDRPEKVLEYLDEGSFV